MWTDPLVGNIAQPHIHGPLYNVLHTRSLHEEGNWIAMLFLVLLLVMPSFAVAVVAVAGAFVGGGIGTCILSIVCFPSIGWA